MKRRLYLLLPCLATNGPKQSKPQKVKGDDGSVLSEGRSAILCSSVGLLCCLQVTQRRINDATTRLIPVFIGPYLINSEAFALMVNLFVVVSKDHLSDAMIL